MTDSSPLTEAAPKSGNFFVTLGVPVLLFGLVPMTAPLFAGVAVTLLIGAVLLDALLLGYRGKNYDDGFHGWSFRENSELVVSYVS